MQGAATGFVDKLNEDWEYERRHKDVSKGFGNPNLVWTVSQEGRSREGQIQGDRSRFQCKNASQMFRCKVQVRGLSCWYQAVMAKMAVKATGLNEMTLMAMGVRDMI